MSKMLKVVGASWLQTKISSYILGFLGALAILALFLGQMERIQEDGTYAATVFYSEKTGYRIEYWGQSNELSEIERGVARAYFRMDMDTDGWSTLEVETNGSYPDEIQAYAAGIVEGALTWSLIHTHLDNTVRATCEGQREKQCDRLRDALEQSANTWKTYASEREDEDPFWHQITLYYTQIRGIKTGWEHGVERSQNEFETDISDLYWLNAIAEVAELQKKLNFVVQDPDIDQLPGLSSAFVRVVNETAENGSSERKLFVAQNAAGSYSSMMRILKRYKLNYHLTAAEDSPPAPGVSVDFSGYPGSVTSQDEFYVLTGENHRLAVTGTTLRNYNSRLWKEVNITEQVPIGPRVTAANHLATNASSWGHALARSNSGTGCKQWMIVDFLRFQQMNHSVQTSSQRWNDVVTDFPLSGKNKDTKHTVVHRSGPGRARGVLWLLEQVPARTHSADLSDTLLELGYWATSGVPFFKDIAESTNTTRMQELYGDIFSSNESPRALMFKRGYKNATTLESILKLMRGTNMTLVNAARNKTSSCQEDPNCIYGEGGYLSVLGVRGDIVTKYKKAYGVIDTKIVFGDTTSKELQFLALSGPPYTRSTNSSQVPVNKGNVASIYTDQFDDEPSIDGLEIRDLVKHQQEEAEQESLEFRNRNIIKPFQWSESDYKDSTPKLFPDSWAFDLFKPHFSW
ncbi:unnamed protein product [Plutella xylostella]|uniref:Phospholipase B-like n=1 Tax=Plutella xylostella TaxID=51655 RepID=A0A8S4FES8_PLUXY|nr:unnamed protein product [Plutella xylostella]